MEKTLHEILKELKITSKEAHIRIKNNQVKLNGEVINTPNFTIDVKNDTEIRSAGCVLTTMENKKLFKSIMLHADFLGFENCFDSNLIGEVGGWFNNRMLLRMSKKEIFIIELNK